jgi:hypothetical protein
LDILLEIEKHNLSIRRIPDRVCEVNDIRHHRSGDEILELSPGKKFVRRYRVPKWAGYYMCKTIDETGSTVIWNVKKDNLAPNLEDSIKKFLNKLEYFKEL